MACHLPMPLRAGGGVYGPRRRRIGRSAPASQAVPLSGFDKTAATLIIAQVVIRDVRALWWDRVGDYAHLRRTPSPNSN